MNTTISDFADSYGCFKFSDESKQQDVDEKNKIPKLKRHFQNLTLELV